VECGAVAPRSAAAGSPNSGISFGELRRRKEFVALSVTNFLHIEISYLFKEGAVLQENLCHGH
jgi:hypothetical protein